MSFEELALAKSALGEIERWDSPLENGHWTSHLYFGIEAKGSAITGGRLAVAVAESAKATRDLLGVYLRRRGLLGYLSQPGLLLEGIGWDLSGGIFKLYFTCDRKLCKRADVLETLAPSSDIHLEKRWVSLRFAGANLKETRTYAVQKQARLDAGTNPVLYSMSNSLLQRVDIQSTLGTQPPLLNLKSLPVPMMGRGIQDIAKKQIQEFRFAADSIRLWNKDHAVLYYP